MLAGYNTEIKIMVVLCCYLVIFGTCVNILWHIYLNAHTQVIMACRRLCVK